MVKSGSLNAITDIEGIEVGHYTDKVNGTGCTVLMCRKGAMPGVDVRGSFPGTRETDMLSPIKWDEEVHAVLLSGGSIYGLDAASGVVKYLAEHSSGLRIGRARIPRVSAAVIFDLPMITHKVRPGADEGYKACEAASSDTVEEGTVGAGTGGTIGKLMGLERAVKGGVGTASLDLGNGVIVGALIVTNPIGGAYDPDTGRVIAGPRTDDGMRMLDSLSLVISPEFEPPKWMPLSNTTIGVVATNVQLSKEKVNNLASIAHDGLAMAIRPAHLTHDGDTIFSLATGTSNVTVDMTRMYSAVVHCTIQAISRSVRMATGLGGIPAVTELTKT